ncbi:MAG: DinB family protein [Treponema sp.]|nr:DinB family protein [Treponema sp.]
MKDVFLTFAKYNRDADAAMLSILNKLSNEEREKERGSYYHSLSGLVRHLIGGDSFFCGLFKSAIINNGVALKALAPLVAISVPKEALNETQWQDVVKACELTDAALVSFVEALSEADFKVTVKAPWGNSSLTFMLQNLIVHGTHHRGQISQILDELKIDNNYSGIKGE